MNDLMLAVATITALIVIVGALLFAWALLKVMQADLGWKPTAVVALTAFATLAVTLVAAARVAHLLAGEPTP